MIIEEESSKVKGMLRAAAFTYVAAVLATSTNSKNLINDFMRQSKK